MTVADCTRLWQAEAMVDGRLSAADARSFKRHAAGCEACLHELRVLSALRDAGQRLPLPEQTELERRRARQALLGRAHALSVGRGQTAKRVWIGFAVLCAALAVAFLVFRPGTEPAMLDLPAPGYRVVPGPAAAWSIAERGATLRIALASGRLDIAVDKLRTGQRFVVTLPDGELEVRGTRFIVEANERSTRSVVVSEGAVSLAVAGKPRLLLERGERYAYAEGAASAPQATEPAAPRAIDSANVEPRTPEPVAAPEVPAASGRTEPVAASRADRSAARPHPSAPASASSSGARDVSSASASSSGARDVSSASASSSGARDVSSEPEASPPTFAQAMAAFGAGDYGRAEALFRQFEREHPADARVEDTTFLRAVARKRRGDASGAAAAASEYLRKYPAGFRRAEAERLLR